MSEYQRVVESPASFSVLSSSSSISADPLDGASVIIPPITRGSSTAAPFSRKAIRHRFRVVVYRTSPSRRATFQLREYYGWSCAKSRSKGSCFKPNPGNSPLPLPGFSEPRQKLSLEFRSLPQYSGSLLWKFTFCFEFRERVSCVHCDDSCIDDSREIFIQKLEVVPGDFPDFDTLPPSLSTQESILSQALSALNSATKTSTGSIDSRLSDSEEAGLSSAVRRWVPDDELGGKLPVLRVALPLLPEVPSRFLSLADDSAEVYLLDHTSPDIIGYQNSSSSGLFELHNERRRFSRQWLSCMCIPFRSCLPSSADCEGVIRPYPEWVSWKF